MDTRKQIQIVLVEDDLRQVNLIKYHLKSRPFHLIVFHTGKEALAFVSDHSNIDIILINNNLPDMNGVDFIRKLHINGHEHSVIFISDSSDLHILTQAMREGALDFILKNSPDFKDELLLVIQKIINLQAKNKKHIEAEEAIFLKNKDLTISEFSLKLLINNLPFMTWLKDSHGKFIIVNELFADFLGMPIPEIINKTLVQINPGKWACEDSVEDENILQHNKPMFWEKILPFKNEDRWFEIYKIPNSDNSGNVIGLTGIYKDINEKKKLEDVITKQIVQDALLNEISSNFLSLSYTEKDDGVLYALQTIGKSIQAEYGYIFTFNTEENQIESYYEWCDKSFEPRIKKSLFLPESIVQWMRNISDKHAYFHFNNAEDMPSFMNPVKAKLRMFKIGSLIAVPMIAEDNTCIGILGFVSSLCPNNWQKESRKLVVKLTDIIVRALEHKKWKNRLELSEQKNRQFIENAHDIIIKTDLTGQLTYVNPIAVRIFEYTESELLSMTIYDLILSEYKDFINLYYHEKISVNDLGSYLEFPIKTKYGRTIWIGQDLQIIEQDGKKSEIATISRDITDRYQAQKELEFASLRMSTIIKNLQAGLLVVDEHLRVVIANQTFCDIFSFHGVADQLTGKEFADYTDLIKKQVPNSTNYLTKVKKIIKNRQIVSNEIIKMKDGRFLERDFVPMLLHKSYIGHIWMFRDISARKHSEDLIRKSQENLEIALKSAEEASLYKTRFLANMSHEIRTPMNGIIGLGRLLSRTALDETQKNYLEAILNSAGNLLVIINDILDISKINEGKLQLEQIAFRLDYLVQNIHKFLNYRSIDSDVELRIDFDKRLNPVLIGDPVRINQVLINLVGNALKFTE